MSNYFTLVSALEQALGTDRLKQRIRRLEALMATVEDVLAQLDSATNDLATKLQELQTEVANFDSATADKFTPIVQRLQTLAADPGNPVPEPTA